MHYSKQILKSNALTRNIHCERRQEIYDFFRQYIVWVWKLYLNYFLVLLFFSLVGSLTPCEHIALLCIIMNKKNYFLFLMKALNIYKNIFLVIYEQDVYYAFWFINCFFLLFCNAWVENCLYTLTCRIKYQNQL